MTKIPQDPRIGFRNEEGKIVKNPTAFAMVVSRKLKRPTPTGERQEKVWMFWNKNENPNATKVWFGPNKQYFYVLPPASSGLDAETRAELENIVNELNKEPIKEEIAEKTPKIAKTVEKTEE